MGMKVHVYTYHVETCRALMEKYASVFAEKPYVVEKLDTVPESIMFLYNEYTLCPYWRQWIKAAKRIDLAVSGDVK